MNSIIHEEPDNRRQTSTAGIRPSITPTPLATMSLMLKARSQQSEASSSLASKIETLIDRLQLSDKALSIRLLPVSQGIGNAREQKMDIRFNKLGFKEVLILLNEISSLSGNVRIAELKVKKRGNLATMNMVVSSLLFEKGIDL